MRVGRILLALLAPLVSMPALAAASAQDALQPQAQTPAVDSLLQLLRSVVPAVAAATEADDQAPIQAVHAEWPVSSLSEIRLPFSPAHQATLRFLLRQQQRPLLRC